MATWRSFWRLTGFERRIVLEAAVGLTVTWIGLRLAGFRRWKKLLERLAPMHGPGPDASKFSLEEVASITVRMEEAAARNLFFATNCLEQSLVLCWLLRRRGIPADLLMGARKDANRFEAHAWVEFRGTVLNSNGQEHLHFVPFEGQASWMGTS
jgi:hypothetical protein